MKFLPKHPWMSSMGDIEHYLCTCRKCRFHQQYVIGDFDTIECSEAEKDDVIHVDKVPTTCPKCGGKILKTRMTEIIRF